VSVGFRDPDRDPRGAARRRSFPGGSTLSRTSTIDLPGAAPGPAQPDARHAPSAGSNPPGEGPSAPGAASPETRELGRRVRQARIERRLTLKDVERGSGLSATHLSEIERGRTSPTIGALIRVARSLGCEPSYFVETDELPEVAHLRREENGRSHLAPGVTAETLTTGIPGSEIRAYRLRFAEPGAELLLESQPAGDAVFLVLTGAVDVAIGERRWVLAAGDALQTPLDRCRRVRARSEEPSEMMAVLTRPLDGAA
jgi:transcriptional regulator with XRE-family HTH domain